jgi:hypothetical protein
MLPPLFSGWRVSPTHRFGAGTTTLELRERFRFVDNPPSAETFNALLPQLSYAEERAAGRE